MWIPFAILSALSAALVAIFGKFAVVKSIDPTVATTIRAMFMAVLLLAVTLTTGKGNALFGVSNRAYPAILASAAAGALSWLFYFWALRFGPAGSVAAIDRLSVVFVVLLAGVFLSEGLTAQKILGALFMLAGALLIAR